MKNLRLFRTLNGLSATELTSFSKFLASPYFNRRLDVQQLFDWFKQHRKEPEWDKIKLWQTIHPHKTYDEKGLHLIFSYLQRLLERFLAAESLNANRAEIKKQAALRLQQNTNSDMAGNFLQEAEQWLDKANYRDADYHLRKHQMRFSRYLQQLAEFPDHTPEIQDLADSFDLAFATNKLRESCRLLAHNRIYGKTLQMGLMDSLLAWAEEDSRMQIPAIAVYVYNYKMLLYPDEEQHFKAFKKLLLQHGDLFQRDEIRYLYLLAINYGIQRVNKGDRSYFQDIFDFYQQGLDSGYFLQNGRLSRFTYYNIVAVALQVDKSDWAEDFLESWTPKLDRRYRESMYGFNQAKLAYHRQQYDLAITQLQKANYRHVLLNLGARTLLIKIYYELDEYDALYSQLDALQSYLRRKSDLSYHRANYRNLIRYMRQLLKINLDDKTQCEQLAQQIQKEQILTEKDWLLAQLT